MRQHLPKGVGMKHLTQDGLNSIDMKLSTRPRKAPESGTPANGF
jgi:IS30 family transposase